MFTEMNNFLYTGIVNILSWWCITMIRNKRFLYIPVCINSYTLRITWIVQNMYGQMLKMFCLIFYTVLHTYLLAPWSTVLFEKLTGSQVVKKFLHFMKPKFHYSIHKYLSVSWAHTSGSIQVWGTSLYFITWYVFMVRSCSHIIKTLSWIATPCWLSATAYSIYSRLPSILESVPPSASPGRAMPWCQVFTYLGYIAYYVGFIITNDSEDVLSVCILNTTALFLLDMFHS